MIMDEGTISAAARRLNISQPALSLTLKQFEDRLQYPLFRRERKRLIPTDEALKLISASDEVFEAVGRLDRLARNMQTGGRQTLRIGVVQALAFKVVPSAIGELLELTDDYSFHIQTGTEGEMQRELKSGLLDAIVRLGTSVDPELYSWQIGECRAVLVVLKELLDNEREEPINLGDLTLVDILGSGPFGRFVTEQLLSKTTKRSSRVATETLYAALHFVEKNGFAAVMDEFTANMGVSDKIEIRYLAGIDPFAMSLIVRSSEKSDEINMQLYKALSRTINLHHQCKEPFGSVAVV